MFQFSVHSENYRIEDLTNPNTCVVVTAKWCGPCKNFKQAGGLYESIRQNNPQVAFINLDADDTDEDIIEQLGVTGYPTILKWRGNEWQQWDRVENFTVWWNK